MTDDIYYYSLRVATKDCAANDQLKLPNLMDYLQEAAGANANALGFSTFHLLSKNVTWVLSRMKITIHHWPQLNDQIKIETWPSGMDKYFTYRDFKVWSEKGELLVEAASNWVVMDVKARKMIAMPEWIAQADFVRDRGNLPQVTGKIKFDTPKISHTTPVSVSWFDLDINNHVNNTKYVQWALDSLGGNFLNQHSLRAMDIIFKLESQYDDHFYSNSYNVAESNSYLHSIAHTVSDQQHVLAQSWWES